MREDSLENIQKQIEIYNESHPENPVMLTPKYIDVKDLFICSYNEGEVGLFKKKNYHTPIIEAGNIDHCFQAGSIYIGQNSTEVCIKTDHNGWFALSHMEQAGFMACCDGEVYIATSDMKGDVSFDYLRLLMYQQGRIENYILGKATDKDILDVLCYAKEEYFKKSYTKRR